MSQKRHIDFEDILSDQRIEEDFFEVPLGGRVFRFSFMAAAIVTGILFLSFSFLTIIRGNFYSARALGNISDERIEEAPRGVILDRFGDPIVHNEPAAKVVLSPRDFSGDSQGRLNALRTIADALLIPRADLLRMIEERDWGQSDRLVLKENPTHEELVTIEGLNIPGVYVEPSFVRVPEDPRAFSHILGYTGLVGKNDIAENADLSIDDKVGRAGLEAQYDSLLRGVNGKSVFFRDATGSAKERKSAEQAKQGNTLKTNIDKGLQEYAYNRLAEGLAEIGRDSGLVIALDPRNGEVRALVNMPSYDVTDIGAALQDSKNPLFNRAIMGVYNPGSTIKPLVALGALTEGVVTPETSVYSAGFIEIPNPYTPSAPSRFLDWKAHGWVNAQSALARSSNVYFYEVTGGFQNQRGIGIEKLKKWWENFRLDKKTEIDIPGERVGFLPDPEWKERVKDDPWRLGDTYNVAIGQGDFMITPIALVNYIATIANGGTIWKPRILNAVLDTQGNVLSETHPEALADLRERIAGALPTVRRGMRDAVEEPYGTAHLLGNLPIAVAAKTGTAQIQNNQKTNAFFVGYAPYDNPELAIIVLVENSREGGRNTVPIAKDIFMWYYQNRLSN
jgi:penicillin-binding protein 2